MSDTSMTWLAADYHLPSTYSCRLPLSSMTSASVTPAPGPGTVRLALIRVGIEIFGLDEVRDTLFSHIRSVPIRIRPPERVALSGQMLRGYKAEEGRTGVQLHESILYREMAHAEGPITIYVEVPTADIARWERLLLTIGYWGQASSFASCMQISQTPPRLEECLTPLGMILNKGSAAPFFSCVLTEFRDSLVTWNEILPTAGLRRTNPLVLGIYAWPLLMVAQNERGKVLVRTALP